VGPLSTTNHTMRFSRLALAPLLLPTLLLWAGCTQPKPPPPPGSEACLLNVRERAGLVDWTARSEAVLIARVDRVEAPGKVTARVEAQWAGRPVENPFVLHLGASEAEPKPNSVFVVFLVSRPGGGYERLAETVSLPLEVVEQKTPDGKSVDELRDEVTLALKIAPPLEAELTRVQQGAPPSRPLHIEYRETRGKQFDRWVYADGVMVRCGPEGATERRTLTPAENRKLANDLRETRFWTLSSGVKLSSASPERDLDLAIEMGGVVLTFHETGAPTAPMVPVLRVFESAIAATPAPAPTPTLTPSP
jgi:hypothetical protein